jgi:hypothetical protein
MVLITKEFSTAKKAGGFFTLQAHTCKWQPLPFTTFDVPRLLPFLCISPLLTIIFIIRHHQHHNYNQQCTYANNKSQLY